MQLSPWQSENSAAQPQNPITRMSQNFAELVYDQDPAQSDSGLSLEVHMIRKLPAGVLKIWRHTTNPGHDGVNPMKWPRH